MHCFKKCLQPKVFEAEVELQEATPGTNIKALNLAVAQAKKAGVEQELIEAGMRRLRELAADFTGAALGHKTPQFEETTPMLVMPFEEFKAQGRICKSTKAWREKALEKQWLVVYDESSGMVVIFVSHT